MRGYSFCCYISQTVYKYFYFHYDGLVKFEVLHIQLQKYESILKDGAFIVGEEYFSLL